MSPDQPQQIATQICAQTDPRIGRLLHALSRLRGRADALEAAIAEGDVRRRLKAVLELSAIVEEIARMDIPEEAA